LTKSIHDGQLQELFESKEVDRELVLSALRDRLLDGQFSTAVARSLFEIQDPTNGPKAYAWLLGEAVDATDSGLPPFALRQAGAEAGGSSASDDAAVDALEAVAFLHKLAGEPFVVCIDQLEVFLRADASRVEIVFSVIKKLIEQVSRQDGLVIIAGTPEAWGKLPRDVSPRMRVREPIDVGDITLSEAETLVNAFLPGPQLTDTRVMARVFELSGGTPRELLRICHRLFDRTAGNLNTATEQDLAESARDAGTLADRRQLALQMIDGILSAYGDVSPDLALEPNVIVERMLRVDDRPVLAVMTSIASDMVAETAAAKGIQRVRQLLEHQFPTAQLIVATIGYASREIAELFGATVTTVAFAEQRFQSELRAAVVRLTTRPETPSTQPQPQSDPTVLQFLEKVSARLERLETDRKQGAATIAQRVQASAATAAAVAPDVQAREMKTRWELLDAIDRCEEALRESQDTTLARSGFLAAKERDIMRRILISNEAFSKDVAIDQLGAAYLDLLSLELQHPDMIRETTDLRQELLFDMRIGLREEGWLRRVRRPEVMAMLAGLAAMIVSVYPLWRWRVQMVYGDGNMSRSQAEELVGLTDPGLLVAMAAISLVAAGYVFYVARFASIGRRWNRRVERLRRGPRPN
jgi:hypothetical protein